MDAMAYWGVYSLIGLLLGFALKWVLGKHGALIDVVGICVPFWPLVALWCLLWALYGIGIAIWAEVSK